MAFAVVRCTGQPDHSIKDDKMSKTEQIADLISNCIDRCQASDFTLGTLMNFLDEMRASGHPESVVQQVDTAMRHILKDILYPDELPPVEISESPTAINGGETIRPVVKRP
jgi:hypothetical protein